MGWLDWNISINFMPHPKRWHLFKVHRINGGLTLTVACFDVEVFHWSS